MRLLLGGESGRHWRVKTSLLFRYGRGRLGELRAIFARLTIHPATKRLISRGPQQRLKHRVPSEVFEGVTTFERGFQPVHRGLLLPTHHL